MKYHTHALYSLAIMSLMAAGITQANDYGQGQENYAAAIALDNAQNRHGPWRAVGRLQPGKETPDIHCSASLIDSRNGSPVASGPAYILTSGHCVSQDSLNIASDIPLDGHIDFDYFLGNMPNTERYALKKLVRATTRGADLAIVELDTSLQSLLDKGIEPLSISTHGPAQGMNVLIVGVPSGHEDAPALRLSACPLEGNADLLEDVYIFRGFHKHRCQGLAPGSSGSPVLDRNSNQIVGVLSTSTTGVKEENRCQPNAPCEIHNGQPMLSPDTSYSSPALGLKTCFSQGLFNPLDVECTLQSTLKMTLGASYSPNPYSRVTDDDQGGTVLPTWSWPFSLDTPFYRYKAVRTPTECESPHHYSNANSATQALIDDRVGSEAGLYFLCIIGVDSAAQRPAQEMMNKPVIVAMEIAPSGPTRMPQLTIERRAEGGYQVMPYYSNPTLWVYTFKSGPAEATQCDDPEGYLPEFDEVVIIEATPLPMKLCSKAYDMTSQPSSPRTDLLLP
ncbi:serine protease [Xanthomonas sp. WHRI 1810A]|uniref:trypsin-like serine peptidase n=1 Tax=Xanthomonas sp. WHRI 1810A TaxID=3161565 RepID=UPI0032E8732A